MLWIVDKEVLDYSSRIFEFNNILAYFQASEGRRKHYRVSEAISLAVGLVTQLHVASVGTIKQRDLQVICARQL